MFNSFRTHCLWTDTHALKDSFVKLSKIMCIELINFQWVKISHWIFSGGKIVEYHNGHWGSGWQDTMSTMYSVLINICYMLIWTAKWVRNRFWKISLIYVIFQEKTVGKFQLVCWFSFCRWLWSMVLIFANIFQSSVFIF